MKITPTQILMLVILIFTIVFFTVTACSNMMDYSETPPLEPGEEFLLKTLDGSTITATALDLDSNGEVDGIDLDGNTSTAEVTFHAVDTSAGTYAVDIDSDSTVDFYILVDYDGAVVANSKVRNDGHEVKISINGTGDLLGIDYNDTYAGSDFSLGSFPPEAPLAPTVSSGPSQLTLNWSAVIDATSYKVFYNTTNTSGSATEFPGDGDDTDTTCIITGLTGGTLYYVWIKATDGDGDSDFSSAASGTPGEATAPVPGNSGTITTSSVTSSSLTLNWTAATDNVSAQSALEYQAYYSTSNNITSVANMESNGTSVGSYAANITTRNITGLSGDTTYYFNVIVRDEAGNKAAYTTVSQATAAPSDSVPPVAGNSGTITTSSVTSSSLTLNWTAATDNVSAQSALEYRAYRSTANNLTSVANIESNGTAISGYTANITTINVTGLTASTTYYFNLIVRDEAGNQTAYTTVSQATAAASAPASYTVSGYVEDSGHGNGTYNQISNINGKVAYEFDNSVLYTSAVYTILWVTARNRWEIYNDSYYPAQDPGYVDGYDYYHPTDTGSTPPTSGWYNYSGSPEGGLTLTP